MPRSVANAVRRLVPPPSRTALFLALLAAAAWLDSPAPPTTKPGLPEQDPPEQAPSDEQLSGQSEPSPWYRPFQGNYAASLISAIVALSPFIVVTTAYALFLRQVEHDVRASRTALSIIAGLAVAGYAFGALLGGDLVQRFRQRSMFFFAEALFAIGCLLSAVAHAPPTYAAGRILSGFSTGLLLVVALPPVIQKFPASKLPLSVIAINIGFFGAVCIGPLLGGWVDAGNHWRWFYGALGAIAVANLLLAVMTLPEQPPFNPGMRFDFLAVLLGFAGVVLPFWASGELVGHGFASLRFAAPMFVGLVCFTVLLLVEYHQKEPLSPVKMMTNTHSITGTLVAMIGGGVFVSFLELGETFHMQVAHQSPLATGIMFWPLVPGALISAALFGTILRTRFIPILVLAGMACVVGGGAILLFLSPHGSRTLTLVASGLLGLGAGATVSPGLFIAGFPLSSQIIGRVFALVELVRSLSDYIIAPVLMQIAREASGGKLDTHGTRLSVWIALWLVVAFTAFGTTLYVLGRGGLPKPDLDGWLAHKGPAIKPTPLLARLRRR